MTTIYPMNAPIRIATERPSGAASLGAALVVCCGAPELVAEVPAGPVGTTTTVPVLVGLLVTTTTEVPRLVLEAVLLLKLVRLVEVDVVAVEVVVTTDTVVEVAVLVVLAPVGAVPVPPVALGKVTAGPPTAEQMASPEPTLGSTQRAPFAGSPRLSAQLPAPRTDPSQRRIIGDPATQ
jgi:hypothetical protein